MTVDLGSLTRQTLSSPRYGVFANARPNVFGSQHFGGDSTTWMGQVVDHGEGSSSQWCWKVWTDKSVRDVAEDGLSVDRDPLEVESGLRVKFSKFDVHQLLGCDLRGVQDRRHVDGINSGESVCNGVVISTDVLDRCVELRDVVQVGQLTWRGSVGSLVERVDERAMVRLDDESPTFQDVPEKSEGGEDGEQFAIILAVPGFSWAQFP